MLVLTFAFCFGDYFEKYRNNTKLLGETGDEYIVRVGDAVIRSKILCKHFKEINFNIK